MYSHTTTATEKFLSIRAAPELTVEMEKDLQF